MASLRRSGPVSAQAAALKQMAFERGAADWLSKLKPTPSETYESDLHGIFAKYDDPEVRAEMARRAAQNERVNYMRGLSTSDTLLQKYLKFPELMSDANATQRAMAYKKPVTQSESTSYSQQSVNNNGETSEIASLQRKKNGQPKEEFTIYKPGNSIKKLGAA